MKVRNSEFLYETSFDKGYHLMVITELLFMVINGSLYIPVVPHKAVAEVSKIGNL